MDHLTKNERSAVMRKVRSTGNRSTELLIRMALVRSGILGWKMHPWNIDGRPDFWFAREGIAVFVDGCFWHGCSRCLRLPEDNRGYWAEKIARNRRRGRKIDALLRHEGYKVIRIWEHQLKKGMSFNKVIIKLINTIEERG